MLLLVGVSWSFQYFITDNCHYFRSHNIFYYIWIKNLIIIICYNLYSILDSHHKLFPIFGSNNNNNPFSKDIAYNFDSKIEYNNRFWFCWQTTFLSGFFGRFFTLPFKQRMAHTSNNQQVWIYIYFNYHSEQLKTQTLETDSAIYDLYPQTHFW